MTPRRIRRSSPSHPERAGWPGGLLALLLALVVALWAGAAACGGSSGSPSTSPSAASTAGTAPLAGSLREAAAEYWRLIDAGDYAAVAAAGAPGEPPSATAATSGIAHARLAIVDQVIRQEKAPDGPRVAQVRVYIEPTSVSGQPSPWGSPGEHTLFMYMERAPQGGWLVKSWGTGP